MEFKVGADSDGILLRSYLKKISLSNKLVAHLKAVEGGITVNGDNVTVRYTLKSGDILRLAIEDTESSDSIAPVDLPLDIIYEDEDTVVCNKPPFMPTHPSHNHFDDTLANALAFYYLGKPFVFRPVNRLDRNTSGTVLIAKNARAAGILFSEMKKRNIEKTYLSVTEGEFSGSGIIEKHMCRTEASIIVRRVCDENETGAQYAKTEYEVLECGNGLSLVRLKPLTGRTHQLRVHLASIGHPILGDDIYGNVSEIIARQALHAESLIFSRPSDGKRIEVKAPLPNDIEKAVRRINTDQFSEKI